ncbi:N-acetyltransferase [Nocardia sp. BMG51109]|uniref:GNAT family N-acetyltransferase n=1 Tax=Nocardia sp. BMG51109 TaxID=1056816 RepID=UPI0004B6CF7E|nr:GNAT family N-acetyltransferase [Nocardia sp. BMG51109]
MIAKPTVVALKKADAGEILTLQRAAYITEAQVHDDVLLPPLTQTLRDLLDELASPDVTAYGIRDGARLVAAVRMRVEGRVSHVGRLVVAPDRQGNGLGSVLLRAVEFLVPESVAEMRLFTGEHSRSNIRLCERFGYREIERTPAGAHQLVHLAKALDRPATVSGDKELPEYI